MGFYEARLFCCIHYWPSYIDLLHTLDARQAKADFVYVDRIDAPTAVNRVGKRFVIKAGASRLFEVEKVTE